MALQGTIKIDPHLSGDKTFMFLIVKPTKKEEIR